MGKATHRNWKKDRQKEKCNKCSQCWKNILTKKIPAIRTNGEILKRNLSHQHKKGQL